MSDSSVPWLIGLGGAAAAFWWWRKHDRDRVGDDSPDSLPPASDVAPKAGSTGAATTASPPTPSPLSLTGRWLWPLPYWSARKPVISDGFDSPRPGLPRHGGVDLMYLRTDADKDLAPGSPNGSKAFVMPEGVVVVAASDGVIWQADKSATGYQVVIDHAPQKVQTYYAHLDSLLVHESKPGEKKERVLAGMPLGFVGFNPKDPAHLKHLHFEMWSSGPNNKLDPALYLRGWSISGAPTTVARNGTLTYRPVGSSGDPYPDWVRALKDKAGVYVIREVDDDGDTEVVYVGSSAGRLYDTLTRHLQTWRRFKGYWKGQYGEGHDPGLTYDRDRVDVAVRLTTASAALDEEMRLIARLKPRDNLIGRVLDDEDVVPF